MRFPPRLCFPSLPPSPSTANPRGVYYSINADDWPLKRDELRCKTHMALYERREAELRRSGNSCEDTRDKAVCPPSGSTQCGCVGETEAR